MENISVNFFIYAISDADGSSPTPSIRSNPPHQIHGVLAGHVWPHGHDGFHRLLFLAKPIQTSFASDADGRVNDPDQGRWIVLKLLHGGTIPQGRATGYDRVFGLQPHGGVAPSPESSPDRRDVVALSSHLPPACHRPVVTCAVGPSSRYRLRRSEHIFASTATEHDEIRKINSR